MRHVVAADIGDIHYQLAEGVLHDHEPDLIQPADVQWHNIVAEAPSSAWSSGEQGERRWDLKDMWLTEQRWNVMAKQYLDPHGLDVWLQQIEHKLNRPVRGISFMRTRTVKGRTSGGREWRRWGSCMLGFGFRRLPVPQLTMHSRTTYLGYIGQLDLAIAHKLAELIGGITGLGVEDTHFVWHLEMAAFHQFKSLAWVYRPESRDWFENVDSSDKAEAPMVRKLARAGRDAIIRADDAGQKYGDMSWGQILRVRQRYHAEVMGEGYGDQFVGGTLRPAASLRSAKAPLPSVMLEDVNLNRVLEPRWWV